MGIFKKMRIFFMGTPDYALPSLERLFQKEEVIGVVTQPDRIQGRGRRIIPSPVKKLAGEKGIIVYQPEKVNLPSFISKIEKIAPDLIVVVGFGQILNKKILSIPRVCCINLHFSLLPHYRGPAPIPWAIIRGEKYTGVTVQRIEEKVDKGEIILQESLPIALDDTRGILEEKLSLIGADLLEKVVKKLEENKIKFLAQDERQASYAPKIKKKDGLINWNKSCLKIHNLVRGLNPSPGAFALISLRGKEKKIKIWQTELLKEKNREKENSPGKIVKIEKEKGFWIKGGDGFLLIKEVQLPDRKRINGYDFIKGYHIKEGFILGGRN